MLGISKTGNKKIKFFGITRSNNRCEIRTSSLIDLPTPPGSASLLRTSNTSIKALNVAKTFLIFKILQKERNYCSIKKARAGQFEPGCDGGGVCWIYGGFKKNESSRFDSFVKWVF
ncbi:hypothetical protein CARUB_v10024976mg [Capsella rubella]|uniref:Uncharacterized protein n=1 Tax=Capsella rubella TaxID=81985 RepID=R0HTL2_9BRAS|nr:hypothetical protein CARUB_v10024976mg [Capsella rubella]